MEHVNTSAVGEKRFKSKNRGGEPRCQFSKNCFNSSCQSDRILEVMKKHVVLFFVFGLIVLGGCGIREKSLSLKEKVSQIKIGMTTEKEIVGLFGKPEKTVDGDVREYSQFLPQTYPGPKLKEKVFIYDFSHSSSRREGYQKLIITIDKKINVVVFFKQRSWSLQPVRFDAK